MKSLLILLFPSFILSISLVRFHARTPEIDPLSNLSLGSSSLKPIDFTEFSSSMKAYNLTLGEIRAFFRLCDSDRNDMLSGKEWSDCVSVFVNPFEKLCWKNKSQYLLSKSDLNDCLLKDWFREIPQKTTTSEKPIDEILKALFRLDEGRVNFMDYVFLRRLAMAWRECAVDGRLGKRRMPCGLAITTPLKRKFLPVSNQVFNIAIMLYKTKNHENEAFLDFFSFAKIAYLYYYFNEFAYPSFAESLTPRSLVQALEEQLLPPIISVETVNNVFFALDPENNGKRVRLSFGGFAGLVHCSRLFKAFAEKKKTRDLFTEKSFKKMLAEREFDYFSTTLLDSVRLIDEEYRQNVTTESKELTEKAYFMRFQKKPVDRFKLVFEMFAWNGDHNWNFTQLVKFMQLTWIYQTIDINSQGVVYREEIETFLGNRPLIISLSDSDKKKLEMICKVMKSDPINVKQFYSFLLYKQVFRRYQQSSDPKLVNLSGLKAGLATLALGLSQENIANSKEGSMEASLYNFERGFKKAASEEAELIRRKELTK